MDAKKIVHYCWFGKGAKPPDVVRCLASWDRHLGGYEIREWNEDNCSLDHPYLKAAHERGLWSKVANLIRLQVLWQHGGIYLDTDIEVLKSFDDLLGEGCAVGFQQERHDKDWVNNAVIIARAGHPFLKHCIDLTLDHFARTGEFLVSPRMTTAALKEWGLVKYGTQRVRDVLVLEADYFYPIPYWEAYNPLKISDNTYCVHHWHFSWKVGAAPRPKPPGNPVVRGIRSAGRSLSGALVDLTFPDTHEGTPFFRRALQWAFAALRRPLAELKYWLLYGLPGIKRALRRLMRREEHRLGGSQLLFARFSGRVLDGPFAGMRLLSGDISQLTPKLLGTYERELHPWIEWVVKRHYAHFINIGCAEGYYAVGLALRCPWIRGYAFDTELGARRGTSMLAALNGVGSRIEIGAHCSSETLSRLPTLDTIILCDIEGAEDELLDPRLTPSLLQRDILVEVHDGPKGDRIGNLLTERFSRSHECELMSYRGRTSLDCKLFAQQLGVYERQALVEEFRLRGIQWMLLRQRSPGQSGP